LSEKQKICEGKREKKQTESEEEGVKGDTKRGGGFQWIQVDMWCSDTGSWSCWTVGRCWGAPCPAKALPFWTRAEPVEPRSILQALPPPLHSLLLLHPPLLLFLPSPSPPYRPPPPPAPLSQALWVQCHVAE